MSAQDCWKRYALISALASEQGYTVGKTALQKIVYFLQEAYGMERLYHYVIYYYGPYATDLAADLDYVASLGGVRVVGTGFAGGAHLAPGESAQFIMARGKFFVDKYRSSIRRVLHDFGKKSATELGLLATIVFIDRTYPANEPKTVESLINRAMDVKPMFGRKEVSSALSELTEKGIVSTVISGDTFASAGQ